ncbi:MAG: MmgE/PrpD family protein [Pseudorhodoplanes sp.]
MAQPATPVATSLVDFLVAAPTRVYPAEVLDAARMCLVDWAGVAIGAIGEPPGNLVRQALLDQGPAVVLSGGHASAPVAALINGTLAHTLDFDDTHLPSLTHISGPTWAAVLAAASTPGFENANLPKAFVAGYEVAARLGSKIGPALLERRIHATAVIGTIGAAAACAVLLGLDDTQTANALGLAATQAGGLTISFGTMAKPFHAGKAAMNGVIAAQLARAGFSASHVAFDDSEGLARALLQDRSHAFAPIGSADWQILHNTFKPYASCLLTHASIDCARALSKQVDAGSITSITARVHPLAIQLAGKMQPKTPLEGKFSLAFCISAALRGHAVSAADFTADRLGDPAIAALLPRVTLQTDGSLRESAAALSVCLADGSQHEATTEYALGNPENPMRWDDMESKFLGLTSAHLGSRAKPLLEQLRSLETIKDIAAFGFGPER